MSYLPTAVSPLSYQQFRALIRELATQNKTTGDEQSEEKIAFTKLNMQRMKRVERQFVLLPELKNLLQRRQSKWNWLVLVEAWCGDGAQLLPAIASIAELAKDINLTVLLRDENPELMDTCLTNGNRAIPILICEDAVTGERLFTWGPRPTAIQEKVVQFKADNPQAGHDELVENVQLWYAKDRSQALQQDLVQVIERVLVAPAAEVEL